MRKKFLALLIIICLSVCPLIACGETLGRVNVEGKQDESYAVLSNGGSAVQYGNYVYFINGYRGYDDDDAKDNNFGDVIKGALYRAELKGVDVNRKWTTYYGPNTGFDYKTFAPVADDETGLEFISSKVNYVDGYEKDDDGEYVLDDDGNYIETSHEVDEIDVQTIAPKTIGSSGYEQGGIFIFDNFVYYASPSNLKNKGGDVEVNKNVFFRTRLDGQVTEKIYSCKNDTASSPYMFYNQGGKVYLTVLDGDNIVSVAMSSKKIYDKKIIAEDVTAAYFPNKEIYFKGIGTNGAEDFVYFTRDVDDDDAQRNGNVLEMIRPDGSERIEVFSNGFGTEIVGVHNGFLFYKVNNELGVRVAYTNLHNALMMKDENGNYFSPTYAAAPQNKGEENGIALSVDGMESFTKIYCFRPNPNSNQTYALCETSDGLMLYCNNKRTVIYNSSVTVRKIDYANNMVYFNSSAQLYAANLYDGYENSEVISVSSNMNTSVTFKVDVFGEYVLYYTTLDEYAADYAVIKKLDDEDFKFIGKRTSDDTYDPADDLVDEDA